MTPQVGQIVKLEVLFQGRSVWSRYQLVNSTTRQLINSTNPTHHNSRPTCTVTPIKPVVLRAEIGATAGRDLFKRATTGKVRWMKSPSASASASAASAMYTHELRLDETTSRLEVIEVRTGRITWQSILSAAKSSMLHHGPEHVVNESTVLVDAGQLRLRGGVVEWTPVL